MMALTSLMILSDPGHCFAGMEADKAACCPDGTLASGGMGRCIWWMHAKALVYKQEVQMTCTYC